MGRIKGEDLWRTEESTDTERKINLFFQFRSFVSLDRCTARARRITARLLSYRMWLEGKPVEMRYPVFRRPLIYSTENCNKLRDTFKTVCIPSECMCIHWSPLKLSLVENFAVIITFLIQSHLQTFTRRWKLREIKGNGLLYLLINSTIAQSSISLFFIVGYLKMKTWNRNISYLS